MANQGLRLSLHTSQRLALLGRMRMAEWIEMPERDFARQVEAIEKDPLFLKLFFGAGGSPGVVRRQSWPGGQISHSFYQVDNLPARGGEPVQVERKLESRAALIPKIRKMGQQAFERYFIRAEEGFPLDEIARRTGLELRDIRDIHNLLLELGAEQEFSAPPRGTPGRAYACLAQIHQEEGSTSYEFFSPYWARGMYNIRYDLLERWKDHGLLTGPERKRLRHLLKRLEIVNLRQSTLFRILETLTQLNAEYLGKNREDLKRPISLRMLARRLDLAPSTVSRALQGRSVRLPWGREIPLIGLVPGRRNILREVLGRWLNSAERATDEELRRRLQAEYHISISRRTVNSVRNELRRAAARPA